MSLNTFLHYDNKKSYFKNSYNVNRHEVRPESEQLFLEINILYEIWTPKILYFYTVKLNYMLFIELCINPKWSILFTVLTLPPSFIPLRLETRQVPA